MKGEAQVENERRERVTNRVEIENDRDDAQEVEEVVEEEGTLFVSNFFHSLLPFVHRGHTNITSTRYESSFSVPIKRV